MRFIRFVRRHPIALLGVFAVAFVVWLWRDSVPVSAPSVVPTNGLQMVKVEVPAGDWIPPPRKLPLPPGVTDAPNPGPQGTVQGLSKLKPGMTRSEVEGLVGMPAPHDIHPATVADGRVTYNTTYEADLEPPSTVRPIRTPRPKSPPESNPNAKMRVTLEYDASKPGHPLLGVHYPDPLF